MAPVRSVSNSQLELLVEFAERNPNIAINNFRNGPLAYQEANRAWEALAKQLNSVGEGTHKTPEKWKRYWHLLKCRTKSKAADIRRTRGGTAEPHVPQQSTDPLDITVPLEATVPQEVTVPPEATMPLETTLPLQETYQTRNPHSRTTVPILRRRYRANHDDNVPRWVCNLEERRIAVEQRLADAVVSISRTNESILECLQQMTRTQEQLVGLLQDHLDPPE